MTRVFLSIVVLGTLLIGALATPQHKAIRATVAQVNPSIRIYTFPFTLSQSSEQVIFQHPHLEEMVAEHPEATIQAPLDQRLEQVGPKAIVLCKWLYMSPSPPLTFYFHGKELTIMRREDKFDWKQFDPQLLAEVQKIWKVGGIHLRRIPYRQKHPRTGNIPVDDYISRTGSNSKN